MEAAAARKVQEHFRLARRDDRLAVLEGFHALKHALRFGADVLTVVTDDPSELQSLGRELAPDVTERMKSLATVVPGRVLRALAPQVPHTRIVAIARRPTPDWQDWTRADAPIVLLEDPRNLGNLGAVVRVAAAADAAAVVTTGRSDPWDPAALRGSAGLHYALPVARVEELDVGERPLVAVDPEGHDIGTVRLPDRGVYAFGTERQGLGADLLRTADTQVRIPMRPGVSSLNLATSVATVLFHWRLTRANAEVAP